MSTRRTPRGWGCAGGSSVGWSRSRVELARHSDPAPRPAPSETYNRRLLPCIGDRRRFRLPPASHSEALIRLLHESRPECPELGRMGLSGRVRTFRTSRIANSRSRLRGARRLPRLHDRFVARDGVSDAYDQFVAIDPETKDETLKGIRNSPATIGKASAAYMTARSKGSPRAGTRSSTTA